MNDLVEICRHESRQFWSIVDNHSFQIAAQEGLAAQLMRNAANKYVEYKNCGVVYRVIRKEDLRLYIDEVHN